MKSIKAQTIPEFLERTTEKFPDKIALVMEDIRLTYAQFDQKANEVRNFLISNCHKQDRISILIDNSIEFLVTYFGILKAGCIAHIIPSNTSENNLKLQLTEVEPRYIMTLGKFLKKIQRAEVNLPCLEMNLPLEKSEIPKLRLVSPEDISTIIYSSGTTSRPKGVKLQHYNVVSATENMIEFLGIEENDIYLNVLPLSHSFGLGNVHMIIRQGGKVIIERNTINIPQFIKAMIDERATVFAAAPATLRSILNNYQDLFSQCNRSLRKIITNSTAIPKETTLEVLQVLPSTNLYMYYGLTEASRSTFIHLNSNPDKLESVGPAAPNTQIKIVDEEEKELSPYQIGEVCVKGNHVIKEYWKNPEASQAIKDNWLHASDLGYVDNQGYLFLKGRKDEIINVGGEKVSPLEIDKVLSGIPGVKDAATIAFSDSVLHQIAAVCVVKESGSNISEEFIIQEARKQLEGYKVPQKVIFVSRIPKTDSGKIQRNVLREEVSEVSR